jgi:hypothetical protein
MLRVDDESLIGILDRLDSSVKTALNHGTVTDQINRRSPDKAVFARHLH